MSAYEPQAIAAASAGQLGELFEAQRELLARATSPEQTLAYGAELACRLARSDGAAIFALEGDWMVRRAFGGRDPAEATRVPAATSLVGLCYRSGELQQCDDTSTDTRFGPDLLARIGFHSLIAVPLASSRAIEGVLRIGATRPGAFSAADVQMMRVIGGMIGAALELAAVLQRAQQQTDEIWTALEESQRSEQTHRLLFDDNPTPMFIYDPKTFTVLRANSAAFELYGYAKDEFVGLNVLRLLPQKDHERLFRLIEAAQSGTRSGQWCHLHRNGAELTVHVLSRAFELEGRKARLIIVGDITERRRAEDALNESLVQTQQALLRAEALLEAAPDPVVIANDLGKIVLVNGQVEKTFGYHRWELLGQSVEMLIPERLRQEQSGLRQGYSDVAGVLSPAEGGTIFAQRKDGSEFPAEIGLSPLKTPEGVLVIANVRDISERRAAEEKLAAAQHQLLQADKMSSVGQLAAGVAHEINNPIGYVYSNLSTLGKYLEDLLSMLDLYAECEATLPADSPLLARIRGRKQQLDLAFLREDITALMGESREGITRVKKIVQDLKDFSHADAKDEWQTADLIKGLDSTLNIVHNELKYKCTVVKEYGELPEIDCLPSQINQVFMNLLVNAAHAISDKGTVTVRTGLRGGEACVEVSDTGCGIPKENLKRIFDPFFTTKPIGKGTGLGLSLSYGIVQKHQGRIEVESETGKGTTFRVLLPQRRPVAAAA